MRKFGVYVEDREVFDWFRRGAGDRRCVEAQVMDFADDVAYSVHDLEDGIVAGRIQLGVLDSAEERSGVWRTARAWYLPDADDAALDATLERFRAVVAWPGSPYDGSRRQLASLKNFTSDVIGVFCGAVQAATREGYGDGPLVRHDADLVIPESTRLEIGVLKSIAAHYVMQAESRVGLMVRQRDLLAELHAALVEDPTALDAQFRADLGAATDDSGRSRVVVDQIASLTDASAVAWHRALCRAG
jgi:dGTPase